MSPLSTQEQKQPIVHHSSMEIGRLLTRRLILHRVEQADLVTIANWSNSPTAHGEFLSVEQVSVNECRQRFNNAFYWNADSKTYLIALRKTEENIGTLQYWRKSGDPTTACVTIKIAVPELRGHGYGTEAQKCLIRQLYKSGGYLNIEMHTDINNFPQQRCLLKLGFELISSGSFMDHGKARMGNLYRLTKEQYEVTPEFVYYYD